VVNAPPPTLELVCVVVGPVSIGQNLEKGLPRTTGIERRTRRAAGGGWGGEAPKGCTLEEAERVLIQGFVRLLEVAARDGVLAGEQLEVQRGARCGALARAAATDAGATVCDL